MNKRMQLWLFRKCYHVQQYFCLCDIFLQLWCIQRKIYCLIDQFLSNLPLYLKCHLSHNSKSKIPNCHAKSYNIFAFLLFIYERFRSFIKIKTFSYHIVLPNAHYAIPDWCSECSIKSKLNFPTYWHLELILNCSFHKDNKAEIA